ncbi:hypothetical protein CRUP_011656 [Coryphaenoides rupestris]|nr:hypothetical protein CRUP_011656 [Coryphaenoides rupestris]
MDMSTLFWAKLSLGGPLSSGGQDGSSGSLVPSGLVKYGWNSTLYPCKVGGNVDAGRIGVVVVVVLVRSRGGGGSAVCTLTPGTGGPPGSGKEGGSPAKRWHATTTASTHTSTCDACCTAEDIQDISHTPAASNRNTPWDHCGALSSTCESFLKRVSCFYRCSPDAARWPHPRRHGHIQAVPLCHSFCRDCASDRDVMAALRAQSVDPEELDTTKSGLPQYRAPCQATPPPVQAMPPAAAQLARKAGRGGRVKAALQKRSLAVEDVEGSGSGQ